jgi:D-alanyl-D-alanine dipeptidase
LNFISRTVGCAAGALLIATLRTHAQTWPAELVNIKTVDPTILIDLRYSTDKNFTRGALYPSNMPALVRPGVAERLVAAQKFLRSHGFGLKIWDAYRPKAAQQKLWDAGRNDAYVSNPFGGVGSMHTRGVAVDATLVDNWGRDVEMPTDFDNFTPAAMLMYRGSNPTVLSHLTVLQRAMARTGFYGLRTEWWHFCAEDWKKYEAIADLQFVSPQQSSAL